jgi:hypothetical protein
VSCRGVAWRVVSWCGMLLVWCVVVCVVWCGVVWLSVSGWTGLSWAGLGCLPSPFGTHFGAQIGSQNGPTLVVGMIP